MFFVLDNQNDLILKLTEGLILTYWKITFVLDNKKICIGRELVLILTFIKIAFACSCFINMICNLSNDLRAMQEAEGHISISAAASSFFREN